MAYAVAGQVRGFHPEGYPGSEPLVPHGMAVILNAPSVFRHTAATSPRRHIEAAGHLGADISDVADDDAGAVLADDLVRIMRSVGMPNGLSAVGYGEADGAALADGAWPQQRLLKNAPLDSDKPLLARLFRGALSYW
jgi:hydroxyacid-oxoacid transhydrogenase